MRTDDELDLNGRSLRDLTKVGVLPGAVGNLVSYPCVREVDCFEPTKFNWDAPLPQDIAFYGSEVCLMRPHPSNDLLILPKSKRMYRDMLTAAGCDPAVIMKCMSIYTEARDYPVPLLYVGEEYDPAIALAGIVEEVGLARDASDEGKTDLGHNEGFHYRAKDSWDRPDRLSPLSACIEPVDPAYYAMGFVFWMGGLPLVSLFSIPALRVRAWRYGIKLGPELQTVDTGSFTYKGHLFRIENFRVPIVLHSAGEFEGRVVNLQDYCGLGDLVAVWYSIRDATPPADIYKIWFMLSPDTPMSTLREVLVSLDIRCTSLKRAIRESESAGWEIERRGLSDRFWYQVWVWMNSRIGQMREEHAERRGLQQRSPDALRTDLRDSLPEYPIAGHTVWALGHKDPTVTMAQLCFMAFNYVSLSPVMTGLRMMLPQGVLSNEDYNATEGASFWDAIEYTALWISGRNHSSIQYAEAFFRPGFRPSDIPARERAARVALYVYMPDIIRNVLASHGGDFNSLRR